MKWLAWLALWLPLSPSWAEAALRGTVVDNHGLPVSGAWVEIATQGPGVMTDELGHFQLPDRRPPFILMVSRAGFEALRLTVESLDRELRIELLPARDLDQEVLVQARVPAPDFSPAGAAATAVDPHESSQPISSLVELVEAVPGVDRSGQGGHFQVFSIRGLSRQRIQTTINGMRLTSQRRAGVSASFLDPLLLGSAGVLRGPSSSYYGSGAMGGVVRLLPRDFENWFFSSGYESSGDQNFQVAGWGDGNWSLGVARRRAFNTRDPRGHELNTHFEQYSAVFSHARNGFTLTVIPTLGRDIGKPNTDFPERTTIYPLERHLLVQAGWSGSLELDAYLHPHDLTTRVFEKDSLTEVVHETFDFGAHALKKLGLGAGSARLGVEYFGRRNVDAREQSSSRTTGAIQDRVNSLEDAGEDELGFHGALSWPLGPATVEAGGRFSWQRQQNLDLEDRTLTAWNGFVGAVVPLKAGFELSAGAGSGARFPALGERFFSGTTGRGQVVGNASLDSERSLNLDAGVRWYSSRVLSSLSFFRNNIDDYIERVETRPDVVTFRNLVSGTIQGLEWELIAEPEESWRLYFGGHLIRGRNDSDDPLFDIPVDRFTVGSMRRLTALSLGGEWEFRNSKQDVGSGEKPIPSAHLLFLFARLDLTDNLQLAVTGRNLLNESYFSTADRKTSLEPGRGFSISLRWLGD